MRSIRSFLLVRLLGGAAVILTLATVSAYLLSARVVQAQFDRTLVDRVQGFASILFQVEDEVEVEFSGELMPEYERIEDGAYFDLRYGDGELLEVSDNLEAHPTLEGLEVPFEIGTEPVHWTAPLPDGRDGRYIAQRIEVHHVYPEQGPHRPQAREILVVLARGREDLVRADRRMLVTCAVFGALLLALIAMLAWRAVDLALAPAGRLAKALEATRVERRPEHLDVDGLPAELEPMAATANALIQRVGVARERERRTTADIAHELRTPISELLTSSEVALRNLDDGRHVRRTLATVRNVAWRMSRSVATLLKLARLDAGTESFENEPVDLGVMVADLLHQRSDQALDRGLEVDCLLDPGEEIRGDESVLRIVVSNLISNAIRYAPDGGRIVCRMERSRRTWRLVVENDAPGLTEAELEYLCEPFWRRDRSRSDRERSGLGLALSARLAEAAGLRLEFALEERMLQARLLGREAAPADELAAR